MESIINWIGDASSFIRLRWFRSQKDMQAANHPKYFWNPDVHQILEALKNSYHWAVFKNRLLLHHIGCLTGVPGSWMIIPNILDSMYIYIYTRTHHQPTIIYQSYPLVSPYLMVNTPITWLFSHQPGNLYQGSPKKPSPWSNGTALMSTNDFQAFGPPRGYMVMGYHRYKVVPQFVS